LTFLIATCKDLGLSYDEYNQKLIKLEWVQISMGNNVYTYYGDGYALEESSNNFIQQQFNRDYKGEEVDFSKYSSKNNPNKSSNKSTNKLIQFEQRTEELLP